MLETAQKKESHKSHCLRVGHGMTPWMRIRDEILPSMSYEAYIELSVGTLEMESRKAMKSCLPYLPNAGESYHHDPFPLIRGEIPSPIALYRRVDTIYGREEYKVVAKQRISEKCVVSFLAGKLMEQSKANKETIQIEQQTQHFFMEKSYLKSFFEYKGAHSLMISTAEYKNISSFIRDPCFFTDGEEANVMNDCVYDTQSGLFFVVLFAKKDIEKGEELFCLPYLGKWYSRVHKQMFLFARISHWYHRYCLRLETVLLDKGIEVNGEIDWNMPSTPLTAEEEGKYYLDEEVKQQSYYMNIHETMRSFPLERAFELAQCVHIKSSRLTSKSSCTLFHLMKSIADYIPVTIDNRDGKKLHVRREEVIELLENGWDTEQLEVVEDICISSPVRYYDIPSNCLE